jgi:Skp family chaperone for outer membrane proteins
VVDYEALVRLKESTNRHIANLESEINSQQKTIDEQNSEIEELQSNLQSTQENLDNVNAEKDSINFLGMPFSKGGYMMLMWGIVGLLVLALLFFIYRYKNSNATTREARKRLDETEREFDAYRTKALEKEQKLGRMLQDERNKSNS